jgi:hypothetical protein
LPFGFHDKPIGLEAESRAKTPHETLEQTRLPLWEIDELHEAMVWMTLHPIPSSHI